MYNPESLNNVFFITEYKSRKERSKSQYNYQMRSPALYQLPNESRLTFHITHKYRKSVQTRLKKYYKTELRELEFNSPKQFDQGREYLLRYEVSGLFLRYYEDNVFIDKLSL